MIQIADCTWFCVIVAGSLSSLHNVFGCNVKFAPTFTRHIRTRCLKGRGGGLRRIADWTTSDWEQKRKVKSKQPNTKTVTVDLGQPGSIRKARVERATIDCFFVCPYADKPFHNTFNFRRATNHKPNTWSGKVKKKEKKEERIVATSQFKKFKKKPTFLSSGLV